MDPGFTAANRSGARMKTQGCGETSGHRIDRVASEIFSGIEAAVATGGTFQKLPVKPVDYLRE
jgi:hypothetical protein